MSEKFAGLWTDLEQEKQVGWHECKWWARSYTRLAFAPATLPPTRGRGSFLARHRRASGCAPVPAHTGTNNTHLRTQTLITRTLPTQARRIAEATRMQLFQESVLRLEKSMEVGVCELRESIDQH